jgi:hypothetical protein
MVTLPLATYKVGNSALHLEGLPSLHFGYTFHGID